MDDAWFGVEAGFGFLLGLIIGGSVGAMIMGALLTGSDRDNPG
jgi:hypothetical protein